MQEERLQDQKVVTVPKDNEVKTSAKSYIALIIPIVGLISTFCTTILGWEPFPFTDVEIAEILSYVVTVVGTIWAWYRNNNVTKTAQKREAVSDQVIPKKSK